MYHEYFAGTHYETGFHWGAQLARHGNFLLDNIGYPITKERLEFSAACVPSYQAYFPEILEEIQGLADGQRCDRAKLQAFLLSMYAMPPQPHCSCFAFSSGGQVLLGRNSDFLPGLQKYSMNVTYRFPSGACSFTGNTTAFVEMEDGVNAHGLAVGLTSVYPPAVKPGMNGGMLLRYFLERCKTTRDVLESVRSLPISSAQTFTVADASGEIAVVECCSEGVEILRPEENRPYVCAVNTFHGPTLRQWKDTERDDWHSERRYQTMTDALARIGTEMTLEKAEALLSGRYGFLCQYDRKSGKDTIWSVIYDPKNRRIFRAEGNPARCKFREDGPGENSCHLAGNLL